MYFTDKIIFILLEINAHKYLSTAQEEAKNSDGNISPNSPKLNKHDLYFKDYYLSNTNASGPDTAYHTFAMQLSSGQRVYGHVRRYLPHHSVAKTRIDVGRRCVRAMVLLTRAEGGENFYNALLKNLEVLTSHRVALSEQLQFHSRPQQTFLHSVYEEHRRLSSTSGRPETPNSTGSLTFQALTISLNETELGNNTFQHVDYSNFIIPQSMLMPHDPTQITTSPMLPLLRCLGISNTLRLFSALMCERRIVLVSQSASRLSACASGATSILAQGLLHWQHIYIPILPPSMMNYLAAPMPYLMGVTANHAAGIERVSGLGEVLVVYLDINDLKTHNMPRPDLAVPDILNHSEMDDYQYQQPQQRFRGIAEVLKQDLVNLLKLDKRLMEGENSAPAVAAKSKDLLKRGFGKLKKVAKKQIEKKIQNGSFHGNARGQDPPGIGEYEVDDEDSPQLYAASEGFNNQQAEEQARIMFTTFFLCLIGDMKTYLRPQQGGPPQFDKNLFVESRKNLGDGQQSPLYPMLLHFKESQLFEMFVKGRVADIQARKQSPAHAALFSRALLLHNSRRIPFTDQHIRNTLQHLSSQNPSKNFILASAKIRRTAMALTSNSRVENSVATHLGKIAQDCRESASLLVEVMSVLWERISDSKGMQWKHAFYSLQIIMELILHGPLVAVVEVTDGIDKIRKLKFYENMRQQAAQDVRYMATSVYNLLINRTKLYSMRRVCALRRLEAGGSARRFQKANLRIRMKFTMMHSLVKPSGAAVSPAPPGGFVNGGAAPSPVTRAPPPAQQAPRQPNHYGNDLLSMNFSAPPAATPSSPVSSKSNDLVQMMGKASVSSQSNFTAPSATPTFAKVPNSPSVSTQLSYNNQATSPQQYEQQPQPQYQPNTQFNPQLQQQPQQQYYAQPQMQMQQQPQVAALQPHQAAVLQQPVQSTPKQVSQPRSQFDPFA